jgi:hypothetical protein
MITGEYLYQLSYIVHSFWILWHEEGDFMLFTGTILVLAVALELPLTEIDELL